jgi:hypothetical protein
MAVQAWQTSNRPPWYAGFPGGYAQWAEVVFANAQGVPVPYRSLVAGNVSQPGSSTSWEYIQGSGEMIKNIPMPSGGPGGPGVMLITQATDFNTFTSAGTFQFQSDAVVAGSPNTPVNGANQGAAGMLEVTTWLNGTTTYYTQFYRDRNGLGFMRGGTNGSWSIWKIWANATQFVVGEMRMWMGTPTEAAVQAAFGPGWHLCNGANGTPNLLQGVGPVAASSTLAPGSTGGSNSVTLSAANMPTHNHVINISDPTHAHGTTQNAHTHGMNDPGHAHGVYDPGHAHSNQRGGWGQAGQDNGGGSFISPPNQYGAYTGTIQNTNAAGTGIGIYGNGTGVSVQAATIAIGVNASATGITATSNNAGNGTAFNVVPPWLAVTFAMYTGA